MCASSSILFAVVLECEGIVCALAWLPLRERLLLKVGVRVHNALWCIVLYCNMLYCIVMYCIVVLSYIAALAASLPAYYI